MAGDISEILAAWRRGDPDAARRLFPLVYDELRSLAHRQLRRPPRGGSLNTTALVHETYIKLAGGAGLSLHDRGHFYALAATAMRQILVDYARRRAAAKRGGRRSTAGPQFDEPMPITPDRTTELLAVHDALAKLEAMEPRLGRIVELRVFGGLSVEETAQALDLSTGTVKRDWQKARAFLCLELGALTPS